MRILVFGNPLVGMDSLPLRMLPKLRRDFPGVDFREFDAVEDLEREGKDIVILDAVQGIESARVFDGVDGFSESPRYSLHDFDLPIYLKLLRKMGIVEKATIIGVPVEADEGEARKEVAAIIRKLVADGKDG